MIRSRPFRPRVNRRVKMAPKPPKRPGFLQRLHRAVREVEPWSILVAVVALVLSLAAFVIEYSDRVEERTVRAWQLLTTRAPGNSGKIAALEYLNSQDGLLCGDGGCWMTLKRRTSLEGIDLSRAVGQPGESVSLVGVRLREAHLSNASLSGALLVNADLSGAGLNDAELSDANLLNANLSGAFLVNADLSGALLGKAILRDANLRNADLSNSYLNADTYVDHGEHPKDAIRSTYWVFRRNPKELHGSFSKGADLRGADLSRADLRGALGLRSSWTTLAAMRIPSCPRD